MDLFALRLTSQLPVFYSWRPDPLAKATDALVQDRSMIKGYANSPWVLVGQVLLAQVRAQRAQIVMVAPVWKAQPWYADLLHIIVDHLPAVNLPHTPDQQPGPRSIGALPPTSCMAHLTEKYSHVQLSEVAILTSCSYKDQQILQLTLQQVELLVF